MPACLPFGNGAKYRPVPAMAIGRSADWKKRTLSVQGRFSIVGPGLRDQKLSASCSRVLRHILQCLAAAQVLIATLAPGPPLRDLIPLRLDRRGRGLCSTIHVADRRQRGGPSRAPDIADICFRDRSSLNLIKSLASRTLSTL